jgi:hypothetical protein
MKKALRIVAYASAAMGTLAFTTAANAAADLVSVPAKLVNNGTVQVRNTGNETAGPTVAVIRCNKVGQTGGCPDVQMQPKYQNPAYPNAVTVNIPKLKPGEVHNHKLAFWDAMVWPPGDYKLTITVDAGSAVAESNEGNNTDSAVKHAP